MLSHDCQASQYLLLMFCPYFTSFLTTLQLYCLLPATIFPEWQKLGHTHLHPGALKMCFELCATDSQMWSELILYRSTSVTYCSCLGVAVFLLCCTNDISYYSLSSFWAAIVLRFWHAPVSLGHLLKTMFKHTKAAIFLWIWKKSSAFMLLKSDCGKCSLCLSLSSQSWPFVSVCSFQFSAITHSNSQQQDLHQLPCCDPAYHCKELGCSRDKYVPGNPPTPKIFTLCRNPIE